jgi:hypothetical protein
VSAYDKWPRLIVTGEPVTREQANEILVCTNSWDFCTNDQEWERQILSMAGEFGRPVRPEHGADFSLFREYYERCRDWEERLGVLNLHYLGNARIASSWIGGPHGWCDWDGRIGCSNYNIGKWPDQVTVTEDLQQIAAAFPYLTMHVQLIGDEGDGGVLDTWAVRGGQAALVEPAGMLDRPAVSDVEGWFEALMFDRHRERGCSIARLREALQQVSDNRPGGEG